MSKTRIYIRCLGLFTALTFLTTSPSADPVEVREIDVMMDPPSGFTQASTFTGFQDVQSFSTIEIKELEAPIQVIAGQLTADIFAEKGIKLLQKEAVRVDGRDAVLLHLETKPPQPGFNKWILVLGDSFRSLSITASYPALAAGELSGPLRESLLSTRWLRTAQQQIFYDLPFTVAETADLKYARRSANMLVLADRSVTGALSPQSPSIVIGHLKSETELQEMKTTSHAQLAKLSNIQITSILSEGETKVDGIQAYSITAEAIAGSSGPSLMFSQIIVFQSFKYLLIQSSVEKSLAQRYVPQFAEVVDSISFK